MNSNNPHGQNPATRWVDEWWTENYADKFRHGRDKGNRKSSDRLRSEDKRPIFQQPAKPVDFDDIEDGPLTSKDRMVLDLYRTQDELAWILIEKHEDYGPSNISDAPGGPLNGLHVRLHDKIARLNHLIGNDKKPKNETIRDTFVDIANYATIALMVIDGTWEK